MNITKWFKRLISKRSIKIMNSSLTLSPKIIWKIKSIGWVKPGSKKGEYCFSVELRNAMITWYFHDEITLESERDRFIKWCDLWT